MPGKVDALPLSAQKMAASWAKLFTAPSQAYGARRAAWRQRGRRPKLGGRGEYPVWPFVRFLLPSARRRLDGQAWVPDRPTGRRDQGPAGTVPRGQGGV